ncbi:MAG TPA: efflux RND transporter permease subunit [Candidatus Limnocylindrales bacterium]
MIRLTELAVAKRSVTLLITLGLLMAGFFSWTSLKQELLPDIQLPYVVVITPLPGASAQDVSTQMTQPIERSIGSVARLSHINSSSINSLSLVVASFSYGTDIKATIATVDTNIKALGLAQTSTIQSFDINAFPSLIVAIRATGSTTPDQLNTLAQATIVPALQGIDGVSKVDLSGASQYRLVVQLDPAKLAANNVSIAQIQGVLSANNLILPAGSIPVTANGSTISIPVSAQHQLILKQKEDLLALGVGVKMPSATSTATAPTLVTIGDLGTVDLVPVYPTGYAELNKNPRTSDAGAALVLSISKTSDANTVSTVEAVKAELDKLNAQSNGSFEIDTVSDSSTFIIESRDSLVREGGLGALFAILTIFVFLLSLRSTFVAAISIPVSIMTALVLMLVAGVTINIMTLGGLAIAVGRVVDDAIVVLENIYRHRGRGDSMRDACLSGTREVASAITSSTLTTVAVFLPLGFVGGLVSQFFLPFALTVTFALLASLICALTVVPVLASLFIDRIKLNPDEGPKHHETLVQKVYTPLLAAALHNRRSRWAVLGIAALLVVGAGALVPSIPTQFLNAGSQKQLSISISPPSGTPSSVVLAEAKAIEAKLKDFSEVNLIEATVPGESDTGLSALSAAFSGGAGNAATIVVGLDSSTNLDTEQTKLSGELASLPKPGWAIQVAQNSMTGSGGISVVISGPLMADVTNATNAVMAELKAMPNDLINVKSDVATPADQYDINVDPNEAIMDGTSTYGVQTEVHNALVGTKAGVVALGGAPTDVYLQVAANLTPDSLGMMPVGAGKKPLNTIATITKTANQARVSRVDQAPAATVSADPASKDTGAVSMKIQKAIDKLQAEGKLTGVTATLGGVTSQMNEAFGGLFVSMAVAILLVYIVMVLVFNSLVDPLVIMFSLPLATIGAFPALFLTHRPIGVSALIGFLMLIGIVVTNAIVLLDLVEQHRHKGMPMQEALMQGGRTRVRPILMTAIATILALMPLALGLSEGEIIASELATVVIGGLFTSTFLTLIVIPVVYSLVEDAKVRVSAFTKFGADDETPSAPQSAEPTA